MTYNDHAVAYSTHVYTLTLALFELFTWYQKERPTALSSMARDQDTARYFIPPFGQGYQELQVWIHWHPESADFWMAKLELEKSSFLRT